MDSHDHTQFEHNNDCLNEDARDVLAQEERAAWRRWQHERQEEYWELKAEIY